MSPKLDLLRSVELTDLLELDLESLQRLATLCTSAIVQTSKQQVEQYHAKKKKMEETRRTELLHEPKIKEQYAVQPVKLNVGGTYFAADLEDFLREEDSFFAVQFGGKWEPKINPHDQAMFINRSPAMFGRILDYLRTGTIDLEEVPTTQLRALRVEADFYQISSLLAMLPKETFYTKVRGGIKLSQLDSLAKLAVKGESAVVLSANAFSSTRREMSIKVVKGAGFMIGVAPEKFVTHDLSYAKCGWHVHVASGALYGCDGKSNTPYKTTIAEGSIVTVKLDEEFNIRFLVDGEDWGIAYEKITADFATTPLYLSAFFNSSDVGDAVQML